MGVDGVDAVGGSHQEIVFKVLGGPGVADERVVDGVGAGGLVRAYAGAAVVDIAVVVVIDGVVAGGLARR